MILIAIWHLHGKDILGCFFPRNKLSPSNFRSTSIARNHIILRNIQIRTFKRSYSNLSCTTTVLTGKYDYWIFQIISLMHTGTSICKHKRCIKKVRLNNHIFFRQSNLDNFIVSMCLIIFYCVANLVNFAVFILKQRSFTKF